MFAPLAFLFLEFMARMFMLEVLMMLFSLIPFIKCRQDADVVLWIRIHL